MTAEDDRRKLLETVNERGWNLYDGTEFRNQFFKIKRRIPDKRRIQDILAAGINIMLPGSPDHQRATKAEREMIRQGPVQELETERVYFLRPSVKEPYDPKLVERGFEIVLAHFMGNIPKFVIDGKPMGILAFVISDEGIKFTFDRESNSVIGYREAIDIMKTLPDISRWSYGDD